MPVVPMKQVILVDRGEEINEWGKQIPTETIEHKARVDEGTYLVEYRAGGNVASKEVVAKARILLDKIQDIRYDDLITYENELNQKITQKPKKIEIKRNISAKPILTVVYV